MQGLEEEFRFLICEKCQREAQNPQLLSCLHTLCSNCLQESKPVGHCPVCQVSVSRFRDNLLFMHLQANLNTYQKIITGEDLVCSRCKEGAEFWCWECNEFVCVKCYEPHQWYLKQKSHEAQRIADVKVDSIARFLTGAQKTCTLFCSKPNHSKQGQVSSIYCRQCCKPFCCSCAVLDNKHSEFYCDISAEIQQRKEELVQMSEDLREKEQCYGQTHGDLQQRVQQMEKLRNETRTLIQEKVEEMVLQIRQRGDQLLEEVDKQLHKERQDTQVKLQAMDRILHRIKTSKQLVEKMASFASDQEVMDMHPFIKVSLDELKRERVPMLWLKVLTRNFVEIKDQIQALCKNVMGQNDPVAASSVPSSSSAVNTTPSSTTPRKRPLNLCEKSIQASPKLLKHESHKSQEGETSTRPLQDAVICSPCAQEMTPERDREVIINSADVDHSPPEICELGVGNLAKKASVIICGHSIIYWAGCHASSTGFGSQLGMGDVASISWYGFRGMLWEQLLPLLVQIQRTELKPDILIIHLGENDLGDRMAVSFQPAIYNDLEAAERLFPGIHLVWSNWLPRRVWRKVLRPLQIDKARRSISNRVAKFVLARGGSVIPHPSIRFEGAHFYGPDGMNLSPQGNDVFLDDLRRGLLVLLRGGGGGASLD